ncbi:MAG: nicotinate-nucleotide adenylyltransferase [Blautia sp.]|nr:nicotinate-nucleotide adenylyltransferase [Blautia sp.]
MIKKELSCPNEKRKIGIMGGTFDPIHIGHLILGEKAYEQLGLDEVWFMPSGNPPHKPVRNGCASDEQRSEMVRLAISDNPHFRLSLIEMHDQGYTYTYRTLEHLKTDHPDEEYYFIIGADSLFDFDGWKEPARISSACTLVAATRNHISSETLNAEIARLRKKYNCNIIRLDTMNMDVSSHMLRDWIVKDQSIRYYVPDSVAAYIYDNKIYRG